MFKDLTKENIGMYMVDCLGYSEEDVLEMGEAVRGALTEEQKAECLAYCA